MFWVRTHIWLGSLIHWISLLSNHDLSPLFSGSDGAPVWHQRTTDELSAFVTSRPLCLRCEPETTCTHPTSHTHTHTRRTKISNLYFRALFKRGVRLTHTILDMRKTHWFALRLRGVAGPDVVFVLAVAGEGWSACWIEAAVEALSGRNAK